MLLQEVKIDVHNDGEIICDNMDIPAVVKMKISQNSIE
jgi:hypothetical protein